METSGVGCLTLKFLVHNVNLFITHLEWTCHVFVLFIVLFCCTVTWTHSQSPRLPSNRHRQSNDDCLEGNRENYQVCSVQFCVQQLCTVQCTHMNRPNSSLDWVLSHWSHFTVLRFIFVYMYFVHVYFVLVICCSIVTW